VKINISLNEEVIGQNAPRIAEEEFQHIVILVAFVPGHDLGLEQCGQAEAEGKQGQKH